MTHSEVALEIYNIINPRKAQTIDPSRILKELSARESYSSYTFSTHVFGQFVSRQRSFVVKNEITGQRSNIVQTNNIASGDF